MKQAQKTGAVPLNIDEQLRDIQALVRSKIPAGALPDLTLNIASELAEATIDISNFASHRFDCVFLALQNSGTFAPFTKETVKLISEVVNDFIRIETYHTMTHVEAGTR